MTKFRAHLPLLACAAALALGAAATPSLAQCNYCKEIQLESWTIGLPKPPKLAAPGPGPAAPRAGSVQDLADWQSNYGQATRPAPTGPNSLTPKPSPSAKLNSPMKAK